MARSDLKIRQCHIFYRSIWKYKWYYRWKRVQNDLEQIKQNKFRIKREHRTRRPVFGSGRCPLFDLKESIRGYTEKSFCCKSDRGLKTYPISSHFVSNSSRMEAFVAEVLWRRTTAPGWILFRSFSNASSLDGCWSSSQSTYARLQKGTVPFSGVLHTLTGWKISSRLKKKHLKNF